MVSSPFPGSDLLQVLARPVVSGWVVGMDVLGYVRRIDDAQRGWIAGLRSGCEPVGLAGGGLVEQSDGQAGVAGAVVGFGLVEDGGCLAGGGGGKCEPGLTGQGGEDGRPLAAPAIGEVDDCREASGQTRSEEHTSELQSLRH